MRLSHQSVKRTFLAVLTAAAAGIIGWAQATDPTLKTGTDRNIISPVLPA